MSAVDFLDDLGRIMSRQELEKYLVSDLQDCVF